jgi:hypothetical protein
MRVVGVRMTVVAMTATRGMRVAQDDGKPPTLGREHVACRHECPQTKHGQE